MKRIAIVFLLALCLVACATNPYPMRSLELGGHASAAEEWSAHDGGVEWWYATNVLKDEGGNLYLVQFTIFHAFIGKTEGFILHLALNDMANKAHYFIEDSSLPTESVFAKDDEIRFKGSNATIVAEKGEIKQMTMKAAGNEFSYSLSANPLKPAAWHGEDGIIVMGHKDKPRERSFYYSYTSMSVGGELTIMGKKIQVTGTGWFDRQWGAFSETGWDWFSLRLFDGTERMLFAFPKTGYTRGTAIDINGASSQIEKFAYEKLNSTRISLNGVDYLLGWKISLPSGEAYRIDPISANQANEARMAPQYWEGLCDLLDPNGEKVGYCVVETTVGAQ